VEVVEALAGTGKTYTAGVLRAVYKAAGHEVLGVAPTGRAARELTEQAGIPARTLDRLLIDLDQLGDRLPRRCVVVFDEAGMAPTRATARLLEAAERAGAKVIAIGDPGQLASVQAGGWLRAVGRELEALRLTEVMRQRDPAERRALAALHERAPGRYLQWAQRERRIETFQDAAGARERAIAERASEVAEVGVERAVLIARDNDTRDALNHAARQLRRDQGRLGEQRSYGARELAVGDRVICRRNDARLDVDNGSRATVRHLDQDRVVIETDSRLVRELPAQYVAEHVEHAYALTGHRMQGGTVETAIVVAAPRDLTAGWSYTALSRARGNTRLLIHDDQHERERADHAPEQRQQPVDRDELLARAERRMLQRDDEDLAIDQLPPAGAPDDRQLALAIDHAAQPAQEHAALRAEPPTPAAASETRLRELREKLEQFKGQRSALTSARLQQFDDVQATAAKLAAQRGALSERIAGLRQPPRRRIGRARDPDAAERARLASSVAASDSELDSLRAQRASLERELGDVDQIRCERDSLQHAISSTQREYIKLRSSSTASCDHRTPGFSALSASDPRARTRAKPGSEACVTSRATASTTTSATPATRSGPSQNAAARTTTTGRRPAK
jgi:AAA domain-containing protein